MPLAEAGAAVRRPRQDRDRERMRRAAATAAAEPTPAMAAALAQIDAAFGEAARINSFKLRVERLIRLGPDHPVVRARFDARALMLRGRSLAAAIILAECWWRDERKAFQIASALGGGTRLSLEVLSELRLILRWMRFKRMHAAYQQIAAPSEAPIAVAAE